MIRVVVRRCPGNDDLPLPAMASAGASGFDLRAAVAGPIELRPGERRLVPTGIALELPAGTEGQVRPRSGLASRFGVTVLNSPGTIDSDYRGEVGVLLVHHGDEPFPIRRGDRIAQLVFARTIEVEWSEAKALAPSGRGAGGFGSTGLD